MLKVVLEEQGINTKSGHYASSGGGGQPVAESVQSAENTPSENQSNNTRMEEPEEAQRGDDNQGVYL